MPPDPILVADRTPRALEADLAHLGLRADVACEISSYLIESLRLDRPSLIRHYLDWRQSFESERGCDASKLLHDLDLLLSPGINLPSQVKDELRACRSEKNREEGSSDTEHPHARLVSAYLDLLLQGNRRAAHFLIMKALADGMSIQELYLDVFQDVLYQVGDRWQRNELTVGQEHFCTAAVQASMAQLYPQIFSSTRNGHTLVATSVAGNLHEIGIRMVADLLELNGWDTHYLGVDCPTEDIITAIAENGAAMLAASATMVSQLDDLQDLIDQVKSKLDVDFPVLVGGKLFNSVPDLWQRLGASAYAADAKTAVQAANRLIGAKT